MLKKIIALIVCLVAILNFTGCNQSNQQQTNVNAGKIQICVTFNAMKEFAEAVGGDKVAVSTIIPDGSEPHDFEPKAKDLAGLSTARVFIYNGLGIEAWVKEAVAAADNKDLIVVEASKGAALIAIGADQDRLGEQGSYDPHLWLSLKGAEVEVKNIKDALVKADPSNQEYYEKNYADYNARLENLYNEYHEKFKLIQKKGFVTGHAAFAYLCRDFGLTQHSVEDVYAEGEPSAKQLGQLIDYCKKNNTTTIFTEEMASPAVSESLANAVGAKVQTIYTMESAEDDKTYLERMEDNLSKIYVSLAD